MAHPIRVDRCVCAGVTFAQLLKLHRETGLDIDQLARRTGATAGCGLCIPYIRATLETGRTSHPLRSTEPRSTR